MADEEEGELESNKKIAEKLVAEEDESGRLIVFPAFGIASAEERGDSIAEDSDLPVEQQEEDSGNRGELEQDNAIDRERLVECKENGCNDRQG